MNLSLHTDNTPIRYLTPAELSLRYISLLDECRDRSGANEAIDGHFRLINKGDARLASFHYPRPCNVGNSQN